VLDRIEEVAAATWPVVAGLAGDDEDGQSIIEAELVPNPRRDAATRLLILVAALHAVLRSRVAACGLRLSAAPHMRQKRPLGEAQAGSASSESWIETLPSSASTGGIG
jgi:hypothetical protein